MQENLYKLIEEYELKLLNKNLYEEELVNKFLKEHNLKGDIELNTNIADSNKKTLDIELKVFYKNKSFKIFFFGFSGKKIIKELDERRSNHLELLKNKANDDFIRLVKSDELIFTYNKDLEILNSKINSLLNQKVF